MTDEVLLLAKRAWRASMDRDDAFAARHRERRILSSRKRSPRARRTLLLSPVVGVALVLLAGSAMAAVVAGARWMGRPRFGSVFSSPTAPRPRGRVLEDKTRGSTVVVAGAVARVEQDQKEPLARELLAKPAANPRANEDPESLWRAAEDALGRGERTAAERLLDALVAMRTSSELHDRATLSLAELELARGDAAGGRGRLASLGRSADPALVADGLFLSARAAGGEAERVQMYERYIATRPPSPYMEQAMVERARALLRGGDVLRSRAALEEIRRLPQLPSIVTPSVADLERRLAHEAAEVGASVRTH
jgi:hypothetical protein